MVFASLIIAMLAVSAAAPAQQPPRPVRGVAPAPEPASVAQVSINLCNDLEPGWQLAAGESLFSALGAFRLTMQDDGNLVLYVIDDMKLPRDILQVMSATPEVLKLYAAPVWSTGTHVPKPGRSRGSYCVMEKTGNFVVYDRDHHPVFETGTGRHPGSHLRLQTDGNLVIYTPNKRSVWSSKTAARMDGEAAVTIQQLTPGRVDRAPRAIRAHYAVDLKPGWRLRPGDTLYSPLCGFKLIMLADGNLVLYHIGDDLIPPDVTPILLHTEVPPGLHPHPLWHTGTNAPTDSAGIGAYCVMQEDGNFVIFDDDDKPRFETRTKGHPGAFLRCQDDGNLVIYTRENKAVWQSKTYARFIE